MLQNGQVVDNMLTNNYVNHHQFIINVIQYFAIKHKITFINLDYVLIIKETL